MNRFFVRGVLLLTCSLIAACSSAPEQKKQDLAAEKAAVSQDLSVWLNEKEPLLRESIKNSPFTLHKQGSAWVVTAPAQLSFNPDRPELLLPAVLGPITRVAKLLEGDVNSSVLILGHTSVSTDDKGNQALSSGRARSVASIFRLSGLKRDRMTHLGMGSSHVLLQANNTAQNHRVEIIVMPTVDVQAVMALYAPAYVRQLALTETK